MRILVYILLAFIIPIVLGYMAAFVYVVYLSVTGKDKTPEMQAKIAAKKKEMEAKKMKRKSSGSAHWTSYPSPLNDWGLWH